MYCSLHYIANQFNVFDDSFRSALSCIMKAVMVLENECMASRRSYLLDWIEWDLEEQKRLLQLLSSVTSVNHTKLLADLIFP